MSKEAIMEAAKQSIVEADEDMAMEALANAEAEGVDLVELLSNGYSAGMKELGDLFGMGEIFLPELIFATEVMKAVSAEIEGKMENLIQAKGFDECMVYYDTDRVDIVVKTVGLTDDEVMQMRDIAIRETSVPVENISIVEINN